MIQLTMLIVCIGATSTVQVYSTDLEGASHVERVIRAETPDHTMAPQEMPGWPKYMGVSGNFGPTGAALADVNNDGYLEIMGRRKEMYISGGYNVYPVEVEAYLMSHPKIAACACIGRPDPVMGEVGMVFVVPHAGETLRGKEVREFCKIGLARYKNPRYVQVIDALPVTDIGKIDKAALARTYLNGSNGVTKAAHIPISS